MYRFVDCIKQSKCRTCIWVLATLGLAAPATRAGMNILSGPPVGSHIGNLVSNGSFELAAPPNGLGNSLNWADPLQPSYGVPPGWTSSGPNSSTHWGNDGPTPYRLRASDVLPDGRAGMDFSTTKATTVNQPPTFNANGTVTFPGTPTFTSTAGAPVILRQTVNTQLTPSASYYLSFWVSGVENATVQGFNGAGIIGLRVTNVLAGDPIQWLAVPNGLAYGMSQVYQYQFTPLNPLLPVEVRFINWGGMDLSAYGMSPFGTQPILDDVIINATPEPASLGLLAIGGLGLVRRRMRLGSAD
jgi:PEP-CTERM motif